MRAFLTYRPGRKVLLIWALFVFSVVMSFYARDLAKEWDMRWVVKYPKGWTWALKDYLSAALKWLVEDFAAFRSFTRAIAWLIEQPYEFVLSLLSEGFVEGQGNAAREILPPLAWAVVFLAVVGLARFCRDMKLAVMVGLCFLYLAVFGQWDSAMVTLASVIIAVPIGVAGGLGMGILAYRSPGFDRVLSPALDLMQTIPIFAYLVPILFMFGFGPVSALVATVIYAMPPMIRMSTHALKGVDPEIVDFGHMAGCTRRQMTWKVLVPAAQPALMVGVNQVIMLTLNMVIIASMIGAGGLGFDVLASLRRLDIGGGFEAGIAIVVLAIAIDRMSQGFAEKTRAGPSVRPGSGRGYRRTIWVVGFLLAGFFIGTLAPALQRWPGDLTLTTGSFWADLVKYLNVNYFDTFEAIKVFCLTWFMLPVKKFLLGLPWAWGILMIALIGGYFGGWRLAFMAFFMAVFILVSGLWAKAMVTLYLCGVSVVLATLIGVPLGVLAALNRRAGQVIGVFIDTLQTLPSFVYLIPVVMLFRVGDFTAMIAIVLYALAPAVRYARHGVSQVSHELIEAGLVSGCNRRQLLRHIRLPLALPEILLGINQTIMLALSMLVITALVGTRDLGQEVYVALTKADTGRGIVAGLAIAFIAIILDRMVSASARAARQRFGLEETHA